MVEDDDERPIHSSFLLVRSLEKGGAELSERERVCSKEGGEEGFVWHRGGKVEEEEVVVGR